MYVAYKDKDDEDFNLHIQHLRVLRWVGSLIYNASVKKIHRKTPEKLMELPLDKKRVKPKTIIVKGKSAPIPQPKTSEEMAELFKDWK